MMAYGITNSLPTESTPLCKLGLAARSASTVVAFALAIFHRLSRLSTLYACGFAGCPFSLTTTALDPAAVLAPVLASLSSFVIVVDGVVTSELEVGKDERAGVWFVSSEFGLDAGCDLTGGPSAGFTIKCP